MLVVALILTAILVAAGEEVDVLDPSSPVGELTVSQFEKLMARTLPRALIPLHHTCTDYSETGDCGLVVENGLCGAEEFYARYCCRSCTLAKQIPTFGPHLSLEAKVPVTARITTEERELRYGENVTLTCEVSGEPAPDVLWFVSDSSHDVSEERKATVEDTGGILKKTRRGTITLPVTQSDSYFGCDCLAISAAGWDRSSFQVYFERDIGLSMQLLPGERLFSLSDNITLECTAEGASLDEINWKMEGEILESSDNYSIIKERSVKDGETRIHSSLTLLRPRVMDTYIKCFATSLTGAVKDASTRVRVKDVYIHPSCKDIADRQECYEGYVTCEEDYSKRYCCRTCTFMGTMTADSHIPSDAEAPLRINLGTPPYADIRYGGQARFICESNGYPGTQKVVWYKGNTTIEESDHFSIEEKVWKYPMGCHVTSYLIIKSINKRDFGKYTCKAANSVTESEASVMFQIDRYGKFGFDLLISFMNEGST
ncbi:neural cell adhesion molecule 1 [Penaeus vannamei]|uniref:neural cell adhesion molecule 1 n=1 Tax=Penaeus vannamei TaxID=6689 RepID=UPI00387F3DCE